MIVDNLKNSDKYIGCHESFSEAFDFLKKAVAENLPEGRYEIDNDRVYAFIQQYISKTDSSFESHKNYIDIQFIASGTEVMKVSDLEKMTVAVPYSSEKDIAFYGNNVSASTVVLKEGEYGIFFPWDVHKPGLCYENAPDEVKKIVVKVKF